MLLRLVSRGEDKKTAAVPSLRNTRTDVEKKETKSDNNAGNVR